MTPRAEHGVPIGLECVVEAGRVVGLDAVDDGRLVGVRVDLAGCRSARRAFLVETLPAEGQDGIGIEPVEGAQADHRVVSLAPDRPLVGAAGEGALEPGRVQLDRDLGRLAGALEAALLRGREDVRACGDELVEEDRQLAGRLDLDPLPEPDLGDGRAGLRLLEEGGGGLEPAGDRLEPLGERRVIAGEQEEEAVADDVERERAPLPEAQDVGIEDGASDVVELELALEARLGGESGGVDRLDLREVLAVRGELGEDLLAAAVAQQVVVLVETGAPSRGPGCRGRAGRSASRRGRRSARRGAPAQLRPRDAGAAGRVVDRSWVEPPACRDAARVMGAGARTRRSARVAMAPPVRPRGTAIGLVSARAARVASITISMSAEVTP